MEGAGFDPMVFEDALDMLLGQVRARMGALRARAAESGDGGGGGGALACGWRGFGAQLPR